MPVLEYFDTTTPAQPFKTVGNANPLPVKASPTSAGAVAVTTPAMAALGQYAQISAYGTSRVSVEPSTSFSDMFDGTTIDAAKWTTGGTSVPTQASGVATLSLAASNSISSTLISVPKFAPTLGFDVLGCVLTLDASKQANPNCHRFFGKGQVTAYASGTPLTDGVGVEVDLTGEFNCVAYVGGTRYVINSTSNAIISSTAGTGGAGTALPTGATCSTYGQTIAWPTNASRVAIVIRPDLILWYIGSLDVPVAAVSLLNNNVANLPIRAAAITTAAVSTVLATTFTISALAIGDSSSGSKILQPTAAQWASPTNATSTAYEASHILKSTPGNLYGLSGYNSNAAVQFILLFDSATLPADAAVPTYAPIRVPGLSNWSVDFGVYGRKFTTGIVVCNSSTGPTKTIGAADCWFDGQVA